MSGYYVLLCKPRVKLQIDLATLKAPIFAISLQYEDFENVKDFYLSVHHRTLLNVFDLISSLNKSKRLTFLSC